KIAFIHTSYSRLKFNYTEPENAKSHHATEIYVMNRDGSNPHSILHAELVGSPVWSPDGKTIAVNYALEEWGYNPPDSEHPRFGLFLVPSDGQGVPKLLKENAAGASWSPDGKKIAFSVNSSARKWTFHVANADGSDDVDLLPYQAWNVAWSPDGKK